MFALPGTFQRRLLVAISGVCFVVAASSAFLLFRALEESEREEAQAWMQATIVQLADRVEPRAIEAVAAGTSNGADLRIQLIAARNALIRELDASLGEPIAETTIVDLAVMVRGPEQGQARVISAIRPGAVGTLHDMTRSSARQRGWNELSVEPVVDDREDVALHAYVPIRRADGAPIAVLRVDADAGYFSTLIAEAITGALVLFGVVTLAGIFVAGRITRTMARPVEDLAESMDAVARGDLDVSVAIPGDGDEFDVLARRFNFMVRDLRDRARMQAEIDETAEIQRTLLPAQQPVVDGYDVFGGARYCDEAGGDYFDFFSTAGPTRAASDPLGWIVADVSGHGLRAALPMATVRAVVRSVVGGSGGDLRVVANAVQRQLCADTRSGSFVTAVLASLDPGRHELRWLSAGHEPVLVFRCGSGDVETLEATGIPFGVDGPAIVSGAPARIAAGDVVVAGTDGLRERRNESGEPFGADRIRSVVNAAADRDAAGIAHALFEAVESFDPARPVDDDLTLVVIRRLPESTGD